MILYLIIKICDFLDCCRIWHLGKFGSMGNTLTVCGCDLPTIINQNQNDPTSKSVNMFCPAAGFGPEVEKQILAKAPPSLGH